MRHKNFVVGMVVGAMLAGAGFVVSSVDAAPRRPGKRQPSPREKKPGPIGKQPPKREFKGPIRFAVECPASITVAVDKLIDPPPSDWTYIRKPVVLKYHDHWLTAYAPNYEQFYFHCKYRAPLTPLTHELKKTFLAKDCDRDKKNPRKYICTKP